MRWEGGKGLHKLGTLTSAFKLGGAMGGRGKAYKLGTSTSVVYPGVMGEDEGESEKQGGNTNKNA